MNIKQNQTLFVSRVVDAYKTHEAMDNYKRKHKTEHVVLANEYDIKNRFFLQSLKKVVFVMELGQFPDLLFKRILRGCQYNFKKFKAEFPEMSILKEGGKPEYINTKVLNDWRACVADDGQSFLPGSRALRFWGPLETKDHLVKQDTVISFGLFHLIINTGNAEQPKGRFNSGPQVKSYKLIIHFAGTYTGFSWDGVTKSLSIPFLSKSAIVFKHE